MAVLAGLRVAGGRELTDCAGGRVGCKRMKENEVGLCGIILWVCDWEDGGAPEALFGLAAGNGSVVF